MLFFTPSRKTHTHSLSLSLSLPFSHDLHERVKTMVKQKAMPVHL